jgi:hypothetical protein
MAGGGSQVQTGLLSDQKDMINIVRDMLVGKDRNGDKKGLGYGLLDKGATPYDYRKMVPDLLPQYGQTVHDAFNYEPQAGMKKGMTALAPSMDGKEALASSQYLKNAPGKLQMSQIQGPQPLKLNDLNSPALNQQSSTYNYQPDKVNSTLDNANFTRDYFNLAVKDPLMSTYREEIAPQINDAAASQGSTFSSRSTYAKQKALSGLTGQMSAQLATAAREDNIERSRQQLDAQQFNVNAGLNNAQFGSAQDLAYAGLNSQNALALGQLNTDRSLGAAQLNSQNMYNFANLNSQNTLASHDMNIRNQLGYDQMNSQNRIGVAENAMNRQIQAGALMPQMSRSVYDNALLQQQVLDPLQANRSKAAQAQYSEFLRSSPENSPWLSTAMALAGLDPNAIATKNITALDWMGAGGGAASGAGMGIAALMAM